MDNINDAIRQTPENDLSNKFLTYRISGQHYGISISNVIEIVKLQPVTEMPELPFYSKGIINLRGRVIPLIDVNLRFGKEEKEYTERTCIIIVDIDGMYVGMIVDAVEDVRDIESNLISPPPSFSMDSAARYVTGIGKLDEYMVLMIDCRMLFSDMNIGALEQLAV